MNFYVNPSSIEVLELGTFDYPYKSLMFPFIEILNYHSNSNSTINIYIYERAKVELLIDYAYIINITQVNMMRYSDVTDAPDKVTVTLKNSDVSMWSPKTRFFLLHNSNIYLSSQLSSSEISTKEKSNLAINNTGLTVYRSSFSVEGVIFKTNLTLNLDSFRIINAVFLQDSILEMQNVDIMTSGSILRSYDPLNLYFENIDIDYYKMSKGINLILD